VSSSHRQPKLVQKKEKGTHQERSCFVRQPVQSGRHSGIHWSLLLDDEAVCCRTHSVECKRQGMTKMRLQRRDNVKISKQKSRERARRKRHNYMLLVTDSLHLRLSKSHHAERRGTGLHSLTTPHHSFITQRATKVFLTKPNLVFP